MKHKQNRYPVQNMVLALIKGYQIMISPLFPSCCRFHPSCSTYACQAIDIHGLPKGIVLSLKRFSKCHPFHKAKTILVDPVPPASK